MKTEAEVQDRIRAILVGELDRRLFDAGKRLPHLCVHNRQQPLDTRTQVEGEPNEAFNRITSGPGDAVPQRIGLCMYGAEAPDRWPGDICEDPIDAQRCPYFTPTLDKNQVRATFEEQLLSMDYVRENLPVVYHLLWVLESTSMPNLPWWKRLFYSFLRVRMEPPTLPLDLNRCLPPAKED